MKLSIVIPAYNEEQAIAAIIRRCLDARATIARHAPVTDVEVIVVSDGSTDRTADIAASFADVRLIVFEKNRGYGAALKRGFEESTGELVAFLDADGTCDPNFFAPLCSALIEQEAAVALGSRMGPHSRMPRLRRLGNRAYAFILSLLSNRVATDTASGMRVIRRDALPRLYPLPDGLHFTPAMSARVLMDDELRLVEVPMPYEERVGESKLHVWRDGVRFLRTILEMTLMWRPARMFMACAGLCLTLMVLLAMHPIEMWVARGHLEEGMIYRLLFCSLLGTVGVTLLSAGVLADHVHRLVSGRPTPRTFLGAALGAVYTFRGVLVVTLAAIPLLVWLIGPGIRTRLTEGYVAIHWSRVVLAGLIAFGGVQMTVTGLLATILRFHAARRLAASALQATSPRGHARTDVRPGSSRPLRPTAPRTPRPAIAAPSPPDPAACPV
ncbi:MAG TPA: glycosyltransferase family 2 protein [Phycisphaerae bacterium]|nr:glycosyltransferase family 2 protein [Phycisphaerae bacterium]HNU46481.1 glycosyltransferase family 2 protein [Phycisphaerae bacterium]